MWRGCDSFVAALARVLTRQRGGGTSAAGQRAGRPSCFSSCEPVIAGVCEAHLAPGYPVGLCRRSATSRRP